MNQLTLLLIVIITSEYLRLIIEHKHHTIAVNEKFEINKHIAFSQNLQI